MKSVGRLLVLLVISATLIGSQTPPGTPKITELFTFEEFKRAGLSKLSPDELSALNAAIFRVLVTIRTEQHE